MKKRHMIITSVIMLSVILVGCGLFFDESEFEDAFETALETGDFGKYNTFVCQDDQIPYVEEPAQFDYSFDCQTTFDSLICEAWIEDESIQLTADIDENFLACNVFISAGGNKIRLRELADIGNEASSEDLSSDLNSDVLEASLERMFEEADVSSLHAITCEAERLSQDAANVFSEFDAEWTYECTLEDGTFECNVTSERSIIVYSGSIEDNLLCTTTITINGFEVPLSGRR